MTAFCDNRHTSTHTTHMHTHWSYHYNHIDGYSKLSRRRKNITWAASKFNNASHCAQYWYRKALLHWAVERGEEEEGVIWHPMITESIHTEILFSLTAVRKARMDFSVNPFSSPLCCRIKRVKTKHHPVTNGATYYSIFCISMHNFYHHAIEVHTIFSLVNRKTKV